MSASVISAAEKRCQDPSSRGTSHVRAVLVRMPESRSQAIVRRTTIAGKGRGHVRLDRPDHGQRRSGAGAVRACRRTPLLCGAAVALLVGAGCGGSSTGRSPQGATVPAATARATTPSVSIAAGVVTRSSGGVTASLHAGTHHPKVDHAWPIRFTATRAGRASRASVSYEYLFAGQVVAHRSHYTFTGRFSDVFVWPSAAVGYPLTFRAVIVSEGATIDLDYPVQVTA